MLNRYLAVEGTCDECKLTPFRGVSLTQGTPRIMSGESEVVAMNSIDEFTVRTSGSQADRLEALYRTGSADLVHGTGAEMFEAVKMLRAANPRQYVPRNGAEYRDRVRQRLLRSRVIKSTWVSNRISAVGMGILMSSGLATAACTTPHDFSASPAALVADPRRSHGHVVIPPCPVRSDSRSRSRGTDHGPPVLYSYRRRGKA